MKNIFTCPYCQSPLSIKTSNDFGFAKCNCDVYPIVEGIIFLRKSDRQTNKSIVSLLRKRKYFRAVWEALADSSRIHRIVTFSFYLVSKTLGIKIPFRILLLVLSITGPSRKWFEYLLNRTTRSDFALALKMLGALGEKEVVVDIGCGAGFLIDKLYETSPKNSGIVGIDKNFLTLLMASSSLSQRPTLICSNVEVGLPLRDSAAKRALFLDSFAWVFDKKKAIKEVGRILAKDGRLYIVNIFPSTSKTKYWGYGISLDQLRSLLRNYFKNIVSVKISRDKKDPGYSIWARKK